MRFVQSTVVFRLCGRGGLSNQQLSLGCVVEEVYPIEAFQLGWRGCRLYGLYLLSWLQYPVHRYWSGPCCPRQRQIQIDPGCMASLAHALDHGLSPLFIPLLIRTPVGGFEHALI